MPSVAFSGIEAIHKATISKHRGVKPSKATLVVRAQGTAPPSIGTLTLTDTNASEAWQEAAIAWAQRRHITNTSPHLVSVIVSDRRWKWAQQTISGVYNTRLDDGSVATTNKKSVRELITVIFQAMGETVDASAAPNDLYPFTSWTGTRCHLAIHRLLSQVGCTIALNYQTNQAVVSKRGTGAQLPQTGTEIEPPLTLTVGPAPSKLKLECAPVVVQSKIKLEAVGIDTDGSIKRIDDLSYKPTDWTTEWPLDFSGVTDEAHRALAQQSVWRIWAIKEFAEGGLSIPELTGVSITKPTQLLPLRERLLETDKDHNDVQRQNFPYLEGTAVYTDTGTEPERCNVKFTILYDQGLVITESPVFTLTASGISEPSLYLTVAHHVRDATTDGLVTYSKEKNLGPGNSTISDSVPELTRTIIRLYSGTSPSTTTDNKATVDAEADKYLDAMQVRYAPVDAPSSMRYRGFTFPTIDGAIAQVVHRMYGGKAETDVSRGYEDDAFSPSERQRESDLADVRGLSVGGNLTTTSPYSGVQKFVTHAGEGRITGTLSALGSQTCRIWVDIGGTMTDTGIDITVWDRLMGSTATMTDKWRVQWEWRIDKYVVIAAACESDTSSTVWGT